MYASAASISSDDAAQMLAKGEMIFKDSNDVEAVIANVFNTCFFISTPHNKKLCRKIVRQSGDICLIIS